MGVLKEKKVKTSLRPGYQTTETKFTKICLGLKVEENFRFLVLNKKAVSLHAMITDGQYRSTSLGCNLWKDLSGPKGSLQQNCQMESFNAAVRLIFQKHELAFLAIIKMMAILTTPGSGVIQEPFQKTPVHVKS